MKPVEDNTNREGTMSPPARGRGLKLHIATIVLILEGRPPRGGVD